MLTQNKRRQLLHSSYIKQGGSALQSQTFSSNLAWYGSPQPHVCVLVGMYNCDSIHLALEGYPLPLCVSCTDLISHFCPGALSRKHIDETLLSQSQVYPQEKRELASAKHMKKQDFKSPKVTMFLKNTNQDTSTSKYFIPYDFSFQSIISLRTTLSTSTPIRVL